MIITKHAQQRWDERFGHRVDNDILSEFETSKKVKHNYVRSLKLKTVAGRLYYTTRLCIFVIQSDSRSMITVIPAKV